MLWFQNKSQHLIRCAYKGYGVWHCGIGHETIYTMNRVVFFLFFSLPSFYLSHFFLWHSSHHLMRAYCVCFEMNAWKKSHHKTLLRKQINCFHHVHHLHSEQNGITFRSNVCESIYALVQLLTQSFSSFFKNYFAFPSLLSKIK